MGYNEEIITLLPNVRGHYFPDILSHRSGLDKSTIDRMRPLFDNGLIIELFYKLLKELHSKDYYMKMFHRDHEVMQRKNLMINNEFDSEHFFEFSNKSNYSGAMPSKTCTMQMYKKCH